MILALESILFVVGILSLLGGRMFVTPRRFVDGVPARVAGLVMLLPVTLTFSLLFVLALVARLRDQAFDFDAYRAQLIGFELTVLISSVIVVLVIAWRNVQVKQLVHRPTLTLVKASEWVAGALEGVGAFLVWWFGSELPLWKKVVLWMALAVAFVFLLRRGWLKLFGPVLFYDLVRSGRRGRFILLRFLYASGLLLVLMCVFFNWSISYHYNRQSDLERTAMMADWYFYTFITVQLLLVLLLTPAYTAGAIAEEKDRRTLEFLLATDLRNREIVLSKLVSRMANLTLLILAGLPILCLMQFLGGVDPSLLLACFAVTGLTMSSLAALSILMSVYAKKPRDAIALTYLTVLAYVAVPSLLELFLRYNASWFMSIPLTFGAAPVVVEDVFTGLNSGNLISSYSVLATKVAKGGRLASELGDLLRDYALFHVLATLFMAFWASARLRVVALKQTFGTTARLPVLTRFLGRPAVGQSPMVWKEVFAEPGLRSGCLGRVVMAIFVLLSFVPAVWIVIAILVRRQALIFG